jgi:ubiquinone/menaquinone biosynthesis C-methylase UbiE
MSRRLHWDNVYTSKPEGEVSWFQESPTVSLDLIAATGATPVSRIIDIGGGASRLVDALVEKGFRAVTVLDISDAALTVARTRLGSRSDQVRWIAADVTSWEPQEQFDIWHDRAAFHFLTDEADRAAYVARLTRALRPGSHAIVATFAEDGPERCSGLPVRRYDAESLAGVLGPAFNLVETRRHTHATPWGSEQRFRFNLFRRGFPKVVPKAQTS